MADKTFDPADTNKDGKVDATEAAAAAQKQSAFDVITHMFDNAGAPELGAWLKATITGDPSLLDKQNELFSMLQNSDPYKARFSGLVQLRDHNQKNPTNPVFVPSEAQYLATEQQMKDILKPVADMYGPQTDTVIGNLIGNQISPAELQTRVTSANTWVMSQDPNVKEALKTYYGISDSDLLKLALDPTRGTAEIQRIAGVTALGAEAFSNHIDLSKQQTESLVQGLVSTGQAADTLQAGQLAAQKLQDITSGTATAYNPNAGTLAGTERLAKIEGTDLQASDILGSALGLNAGATEEIRGLKSRERARFEGGSAGTNVLQTNVSGTV
jgi:hypothetical protein